MSPTSGSRANNSDSVKAFHNEARSKKIGNEKSNFSSAYKEILTKEFFFLFLTIFPVAYTYSVAPVNFRNDNEQWFCLA